VDGTVVEDTFKRNKPIVFPFNSRPFTGGICAGVEQALSTMRAGGRRLVTVPPEAGFGSEAYSLRGTRHASDKEAVIPPNSTLQYELNLVRVSVPPS
jgi:FKBP-type peptidyl-prolyl cis-trans isomerase